jgi:hypothetical protein
MVDVIPRSPDKLLRFLVDRCKNGKPILVTYAFVSKHVLRNQVWHGYQTSTVLKIAESITPLKLKGLGKVCLDTFIVNKTTGMPGDGHWKDVGYTKKQWEDVFKGAELLHG